MTPYDMLLVEKGLARLYRGRLIPIVAGGDGRDEDSLFPAVPDDLSSLDDAALAALVSGYETRIDEVAADHTVFVTDDRTVGDLLDETSKAVDALEALRAEQRERAADVPPDAAAAALEALAGRARDGRLEAEADAEEEPDGDDDEDESEATPDEEAAADAAIVASATNSSSSTTVAVRPSLPKPSRSRRPAQEAAAELRSLVASSGAQGIDPGTPFEDDLAIARAMIERRRHFGNIPDGISGESFPIARVEWSDLYPAERQLDEENAWSNREKVEAVVDQKSIRAEFVRRRTAQLRMENLVASGGLCAPVTPYYQLMMVSTADRPVRASLPSFNADRGGIRYMQPASLSAVTTAVGTKTVANDFAGGTEATKTCQRIPCPPQQETDVEIIWHCLQFGNLGARAFPELVAQWNQLVLASHARTAESLLLSGIDTASTQITAAAMLGASADLLSQVLVASSAMRSRHRMNDDTVLRLIMPFWTIPMMVSDVIRGQFQRFDTDEARIVALLRSFNIEPTFHKDGAANQNQVFGTQTAAGLLEFPTITKWYLFPEGSFIYLDGGVLELGIVRDSVLNLTNDFQIFGESFENVAFVGVESYAVASTTCDNGAVSGTKTAACPSW